ncbi:MAG: zinc ribbon domain-containing protein [Muribaculaceae bacterium]|nr:zinc ribbon domain-containing protein [Muribaculaceae bacterium]
MSSDNKICPYCGEEIKTTAIKCKHCGEFIGNKPVNNSQKQNSFNVGCLLSIGIVILLFLLGTLDEYSSENTYTGFGGVDSALSNLGGQAANCAESGTGKSLVNELEKMINDSSPNNNPVLYYLKEKNPDLKFDISNPRWDESVYDMDRCRADITFKNYNPETIAGYTGYGNNRKSYTIDEAQYGVTYYVSELGGKYKATIRAVGSDPIEGYYD